MQVRLGAALDLHSSLSTDMDSPSSSLLSSVLSFPEVLKRFLAWRVLTCNEKPQSKTSHRSDVSDRLRTLRQPIGRASDCENR